MVQRKCQENYWRCLFIFKLPPAPTPWCRAVAGWIGRFVSCATTVAGPRERSPSRQVLTIQNQSINHSHGWVENNIYVTNKHWFYSVQILRSKGWILLLTLKFDCSVWKIIFNFDFLKYSMWHCGNGWWQCEPGTKRWCDYTPRTSGSFRRK